MAQKPAFGALKAVKDDTTPAAAPKAAGPKIQITLRLEEHQWAALRELSIQRRIDSGIRTSVHDLLLEGVMHVLAAANLD